jgi:transformation/transcription domain-associated protein
VFTSSVLSIARALTESNEMQDYLSVFVRDDLNAYLSGVKKPAMQGGKEMVAQNVDVLVRRAGALACAGEREKGVADGVPAMMSVLDLISQAVNPLKLAQMDLNYIPGL